MSTSLFRSKQFKLKKNLKNIVISGPLTNADLQQQHQILALTEDLHHQHQQQTTPPIRRRLSSLVATQQSPPHTVKHTTSHSILHKHHHHKNGKYTIDTEDDPLQVILVSKYAFNAGSPRELSIKPKQFLRLLEKCGNGWLKVCELENNLQLGLVPASYLDIAINDITRPITLEWLHEFMIDAPYNNNTKLLIPTDCLIDEIYQNTTTKDVWFCVKMQYDLQIIYANRSFGDFVKFNNNLSNMNVEFPQWTLGDFTKINSTAVSKLKQICMGLNDYLQTIVKQARHQNNLQQYLHKFVFDFGKYITVDKENHIDAAQQELSTGSILIDKLASSATGKEHDFTYSTTAPLPWHQNQHKDLEQQQQQHHHHQRRQSEQLFNSFTSPRTPIYRYDEQTQSPHTAKTMAATTLRKSLRHSTSATTMISTSQLLQRSGQQSNYTYSPSRSQLSVTSITSPSRRLVKSRTTSRVFKIPDQPELEAITAGGDSIESIPQSVSSSTLMSYTSLFDQYEGDEEEGEDEDEDEDEERANEQRSENEQYLMSCNAREELRELRFDNMKINERTRDSSNPGDSNATSRSPHYSHDSSQSQSSHNSNYSKFHRRTDSTSNSSVDSHRLSIATKETSMDNHNHTRLTNVHEQTQQDLDLSVLKETKYEIDPLVVAKPRKISSTHSDASLMDLRQNIQLEDTKDASQFSTAPNTPLTPTTINEEIFAIESSVVHKFEKPLAHHQHPSHFQRKLSSANVTLPLQQVHPSEQEPTVKKIIAAQDEMDDEIKPLNVKKHGWLKKADYLTQLEPKDPEPESQRATKQKQRQQTHNAEYIKLKIFLQNSSNDVIVLKIDRNKLTTTNYMKLKLSYKIYHDANLTQHYKLMPLLLHGEEEKNKSWTDDEVVKYVKEKVKCNLKLVRINRGG